MASSSPFVKLSTRVLRVMGLNPGPMTLEGTNTYVVGTGARRCLIDTGEGVPLYMDALQAALQSAGQGVDISNVIITHWHRDHVGGISHVLKQFPHAKLWKVPSTCASGQACDAEWSSTAPSNPLTALPCNDGRPTLSIDHDTTIEFVPTPGHTDDHVTLRLKEENSLFTGDCILGAGSSVFACYSDYMASLTSLQELRPAVLYPGHGPMVEDAMGRIHEQIEHRMKREAQILDVLRAWCETQPRNDVSGPTIQEIVSIVYRETPAHLHGAAAFNVLHHMKKLLRSGKCVITSNPEEPASKLFYAMGEYDGGEGAAVDLAAVTKVVKELRWDLVRQSAL